MEDEDSDDHFSEEEVAEIKQLRTSNDWTDWREVRDDAQVTVARQKYWVRLEPDPETGDIGIWCADLPGCVSSGKTKEEALANIREAIRLYLEPDKG